MAIDEDQYQFGEGEYIPASMRRRTYVEMDVPKIVEGLNGELQDLEHEASSLANPRIFTTRVALDQYEASVAAKYRLAIDLQGRLKKMYDYVCKLGYEKIAYRNLVAPILYKAGEVLFTFHNMLLNIDRARRTTVFDIEAKSDALRATRVRVDVPLEQTELLSDIRETSYYGIGCDPKVSGLEDRSYRTMDMMKRISYFLERGEEVRFLVADSSFAYNLLARYKKSEQSKPEDQRRSHEELLGLAKKEARLVGTRDFLLLQAMKDHFTETGSPDCVKFCFMSDVLDSSDFEELLSGVRQIVEEDTNLAERIWATVPGGLKQRVLGKKFSKLKFAELPTDPVDRNKQSRRASALDLMAYAIHQIATVLYLNCARKGPSKEDQYGEFIKYVYDNYSERLGLGESNMSLECLEAEDGIECDYAALGPSAIRETVRAVALDRDLRGQNSTETDRLLNEYFEIWIPIFEKFIDLLHSNVHGLKEGEMDRLRRVEAKKIVDDLVRTMDQVPIFKYLFMKSGIEIPKNARDGINIDSLGNDIRDIPFSCGIEEGESREAYYTRFLCYLLSGMEGPIGMFWNREVNSLGLNIYESLEKIYKILRLSPLPKHFDEEKWTKPFAFWCFSQFGIPAQWVDWADSVEAER